MIHVTDLHFLFPHIHKGRAFVRAGLIRNPEQFASMVEALNHAWGNKLGTASDRIQHAKQVLQQFIKKNKYVVIVYQHDSDLTYFFPNVDSLLHMIIEYYHKPFFSDEYENVELSQTIESSLLVTPPAFLRMIRPLLCNPLFNEKYAYKKAETLYKQAMKANVGWISVPFLPEVGEHVYEHFPISLGIKSDLVSFMARVVEEFRGQKFE